MAKIVKKKRKLKLQGVIRIVFACSLISYLGTALLVRSKNVSLNRELTRLTAENQENQKVLDTLRLEVAKYTERDYLMAICAENGVELNFDANRVSHIDSEE